MLYDYEMMRQRLPYQSNVVNPYDYISSSPETQANRGRAGGWEEGVSAGGTAVASAFPIAALIMGAGKMAYKGIKSADTPGTDAIANVFAPHHNLFGAVDDFTHDKYRTSHDKAVMAGSTIGFFDPIVGGIMSAIRGNDKRAEEKRNNRMLDWARSMSLAAGYDVPTFSRPTPNGMSYVNDLTSSLGGLAGMFKSGAFNKHADAPAATANPDWSSPGMGGGDSTYTAPQGDSVPSNYWTSQGLPYENAPDVGQGGQTLNLKHGGAVMVHGGRRERDDIALVNADTGEDTGKRVSSGEMIVFSEDTLNSLKTALKGKDKDEVFNLVKAQVSKKPGKKFVDGGSGNTGYYPPDQGKAMGYWYPSEDVQYYEEPGTPGGLMNSDIYNLQNSSAEIPAIPAMPASRRPAANTNVGDNLSYWAPSVAGSAFDLYRMYQGLKGAKTKIPTWNRPAEWVRYMDEARNASTMGFSGAEMANLQGELDRGYLSDVSNIYNASGGNAGTVLGNLGRANTQRNTNQLKVALADRAARLDNLKRYGAVLGNDVNLDRLIFSDKYSEAKQKEAAGAKLANDAIMNLKDRGVVDQFYNPQSLHGKTQALELASKEETYATQKAFMKFLRENPELFKTAIGSSPGSLDLTGGTAKTSDADVEKLFAKYVAKGGSEDLAWFKENHK